MRTVSDTMTPMWTLGDRLAKAREHAGISAQDMAARLGVGRNTISNWENDRVSVSRAAILAYASVTGVPSWWIENDDDDPGANMLDRRASRCTDSFVNRGYLRVLDAA